MLFRSQKQREWEAEQARINAEREGYSQSEGPKQDTSRRYYSN